MGNHDLRLNFRICKDKLKTYNRSVQNMKLMLNEICTSFEHILYSSCDFARHFKHISLILCEKYHLVGIRFCKNKKCHKHVTNAPKGIGLA